MSNNFFQSKIPILFQELELQKKSAADLSKATGISQGNISDWKKGKSKPTTAALALVADFLNTSTEYLLGLTDKKEKSPAEPMTEHVEDTLWGKICRLTIENRNKVDGYVSALLDEQYREEIAKTKNA